MLKYQYKYAGSSFYILSFLFLYHIYDPVTCTIIQNVGAGTTSSAMCYWDQSTDSLYILLYSSHHHFSLSYIGYLTEPWSNETIQAYVTVFGFAL